MDNNLVSVVKGNDFILDLYVSKYDKDQGKQVPYDVSEATDVVLRLIGNNGFIKVIRDAQPNGFKITANVDGRLRDGKYGVELLFKINNIDKRIYQANKIEILNCNCCVDAGAQTTHVIPTYDLSMYIGVDVEKINFGAVTYGNIDIDSVLSETSTNPVMNKVVTAALKEAGKIDNVLVNGESVVKDKVAEIIMPTKVSELDNDADYLTEHQSLTAYAKISDVDASLDLKADKTSIPTKVSKLDNDAGYLTEHQSLTDYAKISDVDASLDLKAEKSHKHKITDITDYTAPDLSPYALKQTVEDNYQYAEDTYTKKEDSEVTDVSVRLMKSSVDLLYTELSEVSTTANRADTNAKNIEDILLPTKIDKGGIKTINGQSLEGTGNIDIMPGGDPVDLSDYAKKTDVDASLNLKADKTSIPTVPSKVSAFTNDAGYLTEHQSLSDYAKKTDIPVIPTKLSAFNNDEGFIKNTVTDLVNYYKKSETYTQDEVNELISKIPKFAIDVVDELPTSEISLTTVYLVKTSETADNMYAEYIYVNNVWEKLGEQKVDLTDYYTKNQIDNFLNEKADKTEIPDMKPYAKISDVDASLAKYTSTDSFNALNTEVLKKANKSYVDETFQVKGDYITEIPAEYVTETELEGKGYLTEHQSLTDYAKKSDIPDTTNFATKDEIPTVPSFKTINGEEITGTGNIEIESGGSDYTAGEGINITDNVISSAFFKRGTGENSIQIIDASQASGSYSLALGYKTVASDFGSHAEGSNTRASGEDSHAEGYKTTASHYSHAEGNNTTASGQVSHAEGRDTKASGQASHAEGKGTKASSSESHAEGLYTTASGEVSHAEGSNTTSSGEYSHTEGNNTTASNRSEHASGQYNISNKASETFGDAGNTLFSVGNGTGTQNKHNAFEIRQDGAIYIADSSLGTPYKLQDKLNNYATKSEINSMYYTKTEIDNMVGDINNILNEI